MTERLSTRCCIAGGGPAGMMLGFLLARAGVDVIVLEKHADFFRDFRGDTIHPSTLEIMYELGLLNTFLALPHQELHRVMGQIGSETIPAADFSHLPTHCKFIAFMPQWDFLNFLAGEAKHYPSFHLRMEAAVTGLLSDGDRIAGVRATTPAGDLEIAADLVVGADGRHSDVRALAGLVVQTLGAPIDVLWMRFSHQPADPPQSLGRINRGQILVMLDRGSYWQCAYIIRKGAFAEIQRRGVDAFRADLATIAPFAADRLGEIHDWADVKLLTVIVDRLARWDRAGLLCIGDAAHAMSPIGGIGINLAIQDAVAAANILASTLRHGPPSTQQLHAVQRRREWPTRVTQRAQVLMQDRVISPILGRPGDISPPWPVRLLGRWSLLQRIPARFIGIGVRPEHVRSPTAHAAA